MVVAGSVRGAAWVPDSEQVDWEVAASLAVSWTRQECVRQGSAGVLVLNAFGPEKSVPALQGFADQYCVTTPRAGRDRVGPGHGPVFVYVPNEQTSQLTIGLACGSSIAAVEGRDLFPLSGWAAELATVDLTRPDEPPPQISDLIAKAVDRLELYKNNGFGDHFGKQQALNILWRLREARALDRDLLLGAVAARGASARALKNLTTLIDGLDR